MTTNYDINKRRPDVRFNRTSDLYPDETFDSALKLGRAYTEGYRAGREDTGDTSKELEQAIEYLYFKYGEPKDGHLLKDWIEKQGGYGDGTIN